MSYLRDFVDRIVQSFANALKFGDPDPTLTEQENVERVIAETALVAACISCIQPIPFADFFILLPLQAKMALHIGKIKGFEVTQDRALEIAREVAATVGMTVMAQMLIGSFAKVLPLAGIVMTFPLNYAATWAIGNVVDYYFDCLREDKVPSAQVMKDLFAEQFRVGKARGQQLDRSELERKADELRRKVAERDADLVTETRLDPRRQDAPRRPMSAASPPPAAADVNGGGRRKIKITLGGGGERRRAEVEEPLRGKKKTIGLDDALPGDDPQERPLHLAPPGTPPGDVPPPPVAVKTVGGPPPPPAPPRPSAPEPATAPAATTTPAAPPGGDAPSFVDQLERLGRLRDAGVLSADEFEQAKRRILGL